MSLTNSRGCHKKVLLSRLMIQLPLYKIRCKWVKMVEEISCGGFQNIDPSDIGMNCLDILDLERYLILS